MRNSKTLPVIILGIIVALVAYFALTGPDRRTVGDKIGDAASELQNGAQKAGRQLEDRTPGEKLQDAAHDAKEDVKDAVHNP